MRHLAIVIALVAGACSKSDDDKSGAGDKPAAAASGGGCDVVNGAVDRMIAKTKAATANMAPELKERAELARHNMEAIADKLKSVLGTACNRDKWPSEVIACYGGASTQMDMAACRKKLPQDQAVRVQQEIMQVMMSAAGRGGSQPAPAH